MAELKVFHDTKLEQSASPSEKWPQAQLLAGKRALEMLEADPTGERAGSGVFGASMIGALIFVVNWAFLLALLLPMLTLVALNTPALQPYVNSVRGQFVQVDQLLTLATQLQAEMLRMVEART